jgi:hypothetical protein
MVPRGCWKGAGREGCAGAGGVRFEAGGEIPVGARAREGCWRMETRSSTRREEARGAIPGRVTVHCWSRVALLRDCVLLVENEMRSDGRDLRLRGRRRRCKSSSLVLLRLRG